VERVNELGQAVGEAVEWAGARAAVAREFAGRWVLLCPLTVDGHARQMTERLGPYPELWTYTADEAPGDVAAAERVISSVVGQPGVCCFAITDRASGTFQGRVALLRAQPGVGSIEVGWIMYAPALRRTRAATEVQYLLMRYAFEELGYRRYEWKCDSLNQASRSAALRLGFVEEGTWRNALVVKGRNRDTTWFSITDGEWPLVKAALEKWLAEENFDTAGHQRQALADIRASLRTALPG